MESQMVFQGISRVIGGGDYFYLHLMQEPSYAERFLLQGCFCFCVNLTGIARIEEFVNSKVAFQFQCAPMKKGIA